MVKGIKILSCMFLLFTCSSAAVTVLLNPDLGRGVNGAIWMMMVWWYWNDITHVDDSSHIRAELGVQFAAISFFVIFGLTRGVSAVIKPSTTGVLSIIGVMAYSSAQVANAYILTAFVIIRNATDHSGTPEIPEGLRWQHVCRSERGYKSFAKFLVKEIAVENILFLTELMQIRHANNNEQNQMARFSVELPQSHLPTSQLLQECTSEVAMYYVLFKKYIEPDSPLEINIDSNSRSSLLKIFAVLEERSTQRKRGMTRSLGEVRSLLRLNDEDGKHKLRVNTLTRRMYQENIGKIDLQEVIVLCDDAANEIAPLMRDSFSRYIYSEEFSDFWKMEGDVLLQTFSELIGDDSSLKRTATFDLNFLNTWKQIPITP